MFCGTLRDHTVRETCWTDHDDFCSSTFEVCSDCVVESCCVFLQCLDLNLNRSGLFLPGRLLVNSCLPCPFGLVPGRLAGHYH